MKVIDIHSHLQFPDFDDGRDGLIDELKTLDWGTIVVGTNTKSSRQATELSAGHNNIWATVGHHPLDVGELVIDELADLLTKEGDNHPHGKSGKIVAIGECGLDYFRCSRDEVYQKQLVLFNSQVELATQHQLPLMLHGRPAKNSMNAYLDMLDVLRSYRDQLPNNPGNVHFFVGDVEVARKFLEMNFTLSFDGPITFARDYDEVIRYVPADMMHAETDAPYAAPVPHRGQKNLPLYVDYVIEALIQIRQEKDHQRFRNQLVDNAKRVFSL